MMRCVLMGIIILLCLNVMTGCGLIEGEKKMEENVDLENLLTRDHLLEDYGITDSDLQGIELETIVEMEKIERDSFKLYKTKEQVIPFLNRYQKVLEEDRLRIKNDKTYMLNAPEFEGEIPELKGLKYLSIEFDALSDDAQKNSHFLDFSKKILYTDGARSLVADVTIAYQPIELDDETLDGLIKELENLGVREWQQSYDEEGRNKYAGWDMGLEFETGEVISMHGTLNENGGYPKTFKDVIVLFQQLRKLQ